MARRHSEPRRRLGRGRLKLQTRLPRLRGRALHRLANRLVRAWPHCGGRGRSSGGGARRQISRRQPRRRRLLERAALYRDRVSARVLSALPRLPEIFSALGAGALPQSQARQCAASRVGGVAVERVRRSEAKRSRNRRLCVKDGLGLRLIWPAPLNNGGSTALPRRRPPRGGRLAAESGREFPLAIAEGEWRPCLAPFFRNDRSM